MSSVLSQEEIDALIQNISPESGGEAPSSGVGKEAAGVLFREKAGQTFSAQSRSSGARNFKLYDFRRPDKLSKDQIRLVKGSFEMLARQLANFWSRLLRTSVEINLLEIDQIHYSEVFRSLNSPTLITLFNFPSHNSSGLLFHSLHLVFLIVDRLIGGYGAAKQNMRELSEFERSLMNEIIGQVLQYIQEVMAKIIPLEFNVEALETDERLIPKTMAPEEVLVRLVYEIMTPYSKGFMIVSLPYSIFTLYFSRLKKAQRSEEKTAGGKQNHLEVPAVLIEVKFPLEVLLGRGYVTVKELVQLKAGSIISLQQDANKDLEVYVNHKLKYLAHPGIIGKRKAVKIAKVLERSVS